MIFFITFLRALAACLITNSHYTGIYPTDLIANGGLLGNILFFAVSGYCLYNVRGNFVQWYGKRIYRIYPPVVCITLIYILSGAYNIHSRTLIEWFIYPTNYHFIAAILLLYIPFYFIMRTEGLRKHLTKVMLLIALVWCLVYLTIYDKSYYHLDAVHEPMIRFLYIESMLLGAWFRQNNNRFYNVFKWQDVMGTLLCFVLYFLSKLMFSRYEIISQFQFLNQLMIFILLFFMFKVFAGLDSKLEKLPKSIKYVIDTLSNITLEVYIIQDVLIRLLKKVGFFPINWILLTTAIFVGAWFLHKICQGFYCLCAQVHTKTIEK